MKKGTRPPSIGRALCAALLIVTCAPVLGQEMQIEGRPVETLADGPCFDLLTTDQQRYFNCNNGTVYDTLTGLLWLQDASCVDLGTDGLDTWDEAFHDVADLQHGLCNLSDHSQPGDWRLPTSDEWETTVHYARNTLSCVGAGVAPSLTNDAGDACFGTGADSSFIGVLELYWSANAVDAVPSQNENRSLLTGNPSNISKTFSFATIWPVRTGGSPGTALTVVVEGATVETQAGGPCYDAATTGEERYVDCGDGTVLDLVTGLIWLANANCLELAGISPTGTANWPTAMAAAAALAAPACGLADGSQPGDWRLASAAEWMTTMQQATALDCTTAGAKPPALTDNTGVKCLVNGPTFFAEVPNLAWTSRLNHGSGANVAILTNGLVGSTSKTSAHVVWPVREPK